MFSVCVTLGIVLLASKYRNNLIHGVQYVCSKITNNSGTNNNDTDRYQLEEKKNSITSNTIILADSVEKCNSAVQLICRNFTDDTEKVLGFDCEWVNKGPISLLQLATQNGVCALFRLCKIGFVPAKLEELLADECILKVGVSPYEDGLKLRSDYGCEVRGTVDLRTLAVRLSMPNRMSLSALCLQYLGVEMDKPLEVRCGNWNVDALTKVQIEYAAYDAFVAILIYRRIRDGSTRSNSMWNCLANYMKKIWSRTNCALIHNLPEDTIDTKYRGPLNRPTNSNNNVPDNPKILHEPRKTPKNTSILQIDSVPTRKEPLYHNCYLQAPDGETLCTCDRKKAEWYVVKNLGVKVEDEPFTVRLNFEPSGRACGEVGKFYTQVKINQCVVCGAQDKFIKKNVVPREYRKYFPLVMKAHQSHDVLLLCPTCHMISNRHDLELRKELAITCDAPLSRPSLFSTNIHDDNYHGRKKFLSAVKALRSNSSSLPLHRKHELESHIHEFTQHSYAYQHNDEFVNCKQLIDNHNMKAFEPVKNSSHGLKVVKYFTECEGGLVALERMWRKHFLHSMHPKYLPELWSVQHNQERLTIRKIQNRIKPEDARTAGLTR